MSERVQVVVCELELLEGNQLPHPMSSCGGGVGVHVQPAWHGGLGFASHHPNNRCRKTNYYKEIRVVFSSLESKGTKSGC